jgi:hypothetical protein
MLRIRLLTSSNYQPLKHEKEKQDSDLSGKEKIYKLFQMFGLEEAA